jgi:hypothetical protein
MHEREKRRFFKVKVQKTPRIGNAETQRNFVKVKVKVPCNRLDGPEGGRDITLLFSDLGVRRGWVVSIVELKPDGTR